MAGFDQIDLNSDLGEGYGPWRMGADDELLPLLTSANIACGGHASDPETMFRTLQTAAENGVKVGAHPGYNDREGFGRRVIPMEPAQIGRMVAAQIGALSAIATMVPVPVAYVKPHGALANLAARDTAVAQAIVDAIQHLIARSNPDLAVLAISGTALEQAARAAGLPVYSEIFADRAYQDNGQLVPRGTPGAVLHDPDQITDRLLSFARTGLMPTLSGGQIPLAAHSICVHGDSAEALDIVRTIRDRFAEAGVEVTSFL